ncbi:MAG: ABC transporter ATP-binding protein [Angelakisella sp.]
MENKSRVKMSLHNISKSYHSRKETQEAVNSVSFDVYENEFLVLLGPGQCGKTVLLNIISGLEEPTTGEMLFDGKPFTGVNDGIGLVFQKTALFEWKTVMQNVEFGLKVKNVDKATRRKVAQKYIDLVGLTGFEDKYPRQLSGGMKQRVGIARAYSTNPGILLMDEPFGQLDAQTRYQMESEVLRIWEQDKRTIVFVTNNIEEALTLGDRIILLSSCPATIKEIYVPPFKKPRDNLSTEFLEYRAMIEENTDMAL